MTLNGHKQKKRVTKSYNILYPKLTYTRNKFKILSGGNNTYVCDTENPIGRGGFGYVLACKKSGKGHISTVAVKFANTEKSMVELKHEIEMYNIMSKNKGYGHDQIVKMLLDVDISPSIQSYGPILVLEYCNNGDLTKYVQNTRTYNIVDILSQIFKGMYYLYNIGILHLDLKPGNILVHNRNIIANHYFHSANANPKSDNMLFKIADFGLAKYIQPSVDGVESDTINIRKMTAVTPIYKPTFRNIDRSTYFRDLYAFFCIIYYLYWRKHFNIIPKGKQISRYETKK